MMKYVHCLNPISQIGLQELPKYYQVSNTIDLAHAILVRSANMHDLVLPPSVKVVARAGAGVNNIPLDIYAKAGVVCFNTPGANANAVKELTLAGMLLSSRDIVSGINWVKDNQSDPELTKTVEKIKAKFGGTEILGKTIGIIGLGAIGMELARTCADLGMHVIGTKRNLSTIDRLEMPENMVLYKTKEEVYPLCDFISLNVPLSPETKHMVDIHAFKLMKDGVIILNFARDALVKDSDLQEAIQQNKVRCYVTDFPNNETANMDKVIAIPHLGASTEEAEENCAFMAVHQMMDYLEDGNIRNSVNFPDANLGSKHHYRMTILGNLDWTSEDIISKTAQFQILQSVIKSNQKYQTMIIDTKEKVTESIIKQMTSIEGIYHIYQI